MSSAGSLPAAHGRWCHCRLGVSPNAFAASIPSRSSPLAIVFLQVRQLARPDFASSIMFAIGSGCTPEPFGAIGPPLHSRREQPAGRAAISGDRDEDRSPVRGVSRQRGREPRGRRQAARGARARPRVGGGEKYTSRHKAAGKLLPRERVELLLDRDSYFLELCPLAGKDVPGHTPGASLIGGIGRVSGVECLITASESTVKGGAISEMSAWKSGRLQRHRRAQPAAVDLDDRVGGRGPAEPVEDLRPRRPRLPRSHPALARRGSRRSASCSAARPRAARTSPGMSDYVVMVEKQAQVYLAGPPLVKMATGEDTDHEELGGAEMHSRISGVSRLPRARRARRDPARPRDRRAPRLEEGRRRRCRARSSRRATDADELLGIASPDVKVPFDQREVIARIVDGSRFSRVQAALRLDAGLRLGAPPRLPDRHPREQRHPVLRVGAEGRAVHPAVQPGRRPAAVPAEHHRLHGRQEGTSRKASSSTAPSSSTRCRTRRSPRSRS